MVLLQAKHSCATEPFHMSFLLRSVALSRTTYDTCIDVHQITCVIIIQVIDSNKIHIIELDPFIIKPISKADDFLTQNSSTTWKVYVFLTVQFMSNTPCNNRTTALSLQ